MKNIASLGPLIVRPESHDPAGHSRRRILRQIAFAEAVKRDALESTTSSSLSSTSEEELENAREFRKNALKGQGETAYRVVV